LLCSTEAWLSELNADIDIEVFTVIRSDRDNIKTIKKNQRSLGAGEKVGHKLLCLRESARGHSKHWRCHFGRITSLGHLSRWLLSWPIFPDPTMQKQPTVSLSDARPNMDR